MNEDDIFNFSPYGKIEIGKFPRVKLPSTTTIVEKIPLPKFEINEKRRIVDDKYSFIDTEKLLKLNNKKYTVRELREIATRIEVDPNNKKLELVKLIKLKIGL